MPEGFAVAGCPSNTNEVTARGVGTARGEEIRFCCAAEPTPSISAYGGAMRLGEHCARAGNLPLLPSPIQSSHGGFPLFDGHRHRHSNEAVTSFLNLPKVNGQLGSG